MKEVYEVLMHIGEDMLEPVGYIPMGIAAGAVYLALYEVWERIRSRRRLGEVNDMIYGPGRGAGHVPTRAVGYGRLQRKWLLALCVVYGTVILYLTFLSREPGSRTGIDLMLFETWRDSPSSKAYVIENILMTIPFGILFPVAFVRLRSGVRCTAAGMLLSIGLELAQLVTQRGHCQLDDVVMNTLGAWIGWMVYRHILLKSGRPD